MFAHQNEGTLVRNTFALLKHSNSTMNAQNCKPTAKARQRSTKYVTPSLLHTDSSSSSLVRPYSVTLIPSNDRLHGKSLAYRMLYANYACVGRNYIDGLNKGSIWSAIVLDIYKLMFLELNLIWVWVNRYFWNVLWDISDLC